MGKRPGNLSVAWKAGRIASRRLFGRAVGERDHALTESLVESLDEMKGLAMKVPSSGPPWPSALPPPR